MTSNMDWTDSLREICREECAYPYGEPPCWQVDEDAKACWSCVKLWMEGYQADG